MIQAHRQRHQENAEAQTWKQQSGSLGHRTRLHGNELRLRSGCRQTGTAMKPYIICHMLSSVDGKIDNAARCNKDLARLMTRSSERSYGRSRVRGNGCEAERRCLDLRSHDDAAALRGG